MPATVEKKIRFKAFDNVSKTVDKINGKFAKMSAATEKSARKMDRLAMSTKTLKKGLKGVGGGMKSIGATMSVGLTAPIVAFGAAAFQTSVTFDKSMNKVQALSRASAKEIKMLREQAKLLGSTTAFSASQAADAQAFFAQAGFKTNEIMKAVPATLALAAASSTDLAISADILSNVMGGFNVKADQAGKFADILALTTAKGNVNMEMLGESMKDAAPVAQKYGASIEEVAALTAKLGDAGIQGSKAGTTLKNMFLNLSTGAAPIKKIFKDLGVNVVNKTTGKLRSMTDILVDMNKAFEAKGLSDSKKLAVLDKVFGKRAIAGAGVLLEQVRKLDPKTGKYTNTVAKLTKELEGSAGAAKEMQKIQEKGLPGAVNSFKSAWEGLQIAFMDSGIKDTLTSIIEGLTGMMQWMSKLNPTVLKWVGYIGAALAVIGPLVFLLGGLISALPFIIAGFEALAVLLPILSIGTLPLLLLMGKFILIAGLVAAAAYLIYDAWDDFGNFFSGLFAEPLQTLKDMVDWASNLVGIGSIFGNDSDDVDAKLKAQGFKIGGAPVGGPEGDPTGSRELTKKSFDYKTRQQQASVNVNFANLPKEARVVTEDRESILNVGTGAMGAI